MGLIKHWHWDDEPTAFSSKDYELGKRDGRRDERCRLLQEVINDLQSQPTIDVLLALKGRLAKLDEDRIVPRVNQKGR